MDLHFYTESRPYDEARSIFQANGMPGHVDVECQLRYVKKCLSLSSGLHQLSRARMRAIVEQLETYEDQGVRTITVASYRQTLALAKELQNTQIKLENMRNDIAKKTAALDELARREHELTLAKLGYQSRK